MTQQQRESIVNILIALLTMTQSELDSVEDFIVNELPEEN